VNQQVRDSTANDRRIRDQERHFKELDRATLKVEDFLEFKREYRASCKQNHAQLRSIEKTVASLSLDLQSQDSRKHLPAAKPQPCCLKMIEGQSKRVLEQEEKIRGIESREIDRDITLNRLWYLHQEETRTEAENSTGSISPSASCVYSRPKPLEQELAELNERISFSSETHDVRDTLDRAGQRMSKWSFPTLDSNGVKSPSTEDCVRIMQAGIHTIVETSTGHPSYHDRLKVQLSEDCSSLVIHFSPAGQQTECRWTVFKLDCFILCGSSPDDLNDSKIRPLDLLSEHGKLSLTAETSYDNLVLHRALEHSVFG